MAVCWCREKNCEQIFTSEDLKDIDLFADNAVLPCGHKPEMLVMGASALRDAAKAETELKRLRPRLERMSSFYCDICRKGDDECDYDALGEKCHVFQE